MTRRRITNEQKRLVHERARGLCEYCRSQMRFATHDFSIEHIVPVHQGGDDSIDNLALACQGCNNFKHTRTDAVDPVSKRRVPLFHPRKHVWREHFIWSYDSTRIQGQTPTGRATVEILQLNRKCLVNLRGVLFAVGKHPPGEE